MSSLTMQFNDYGYEEKTTFAMDFDIADRFGASAVKDTFNRAFNEWKSDYEYLTELVMVLNLKCWYWHQRNNMAMAKLYSQLWQKADGYACENLKGEELSYFYRTTD